MLNTELESAFMNANQTLCGRFTQGKTWNNSGHGELWTEQNRNNEPLRQLADWLSEEFPSRQIQFLEAHAGEPTKLVCEGPVFVGILTKLQALQEEILSSRLRLLVKVMRLAADIVAVQDVVAFAAPSETDLTEVMEACVEFARQEEEGMGRWTSKGWFTAAWLPAWSLAGHRALHALYVSQARSLESEMLPPQDWNRQGNSDRDIRFDSNLESAQNSGLAVDSGRLVLWVEAFLLLCVNQFVRDGVTLPPVPEPEPQSGGGSSYRIMYRGEAEVLTHWETALASPDTDFQADGWLVWRTMKQAFAQTSWSYGWLLDVTGRHHYHLELDVVPPMPESSPEWRIEYFVAHNHWSSRRPLMDWWQEPGRRFMIGQEELQDLDTWVLPKLVEAAEMSPIIAASLQHPTPSSARIAPEDVFGFLTVEGPSLEEIGCVIRYPDIQEMSAGDIRVRVQVKPKQHRLSGHQGRSLSGASWFDAKQLVEFDWKVALSGTELSDEAFAQLVEERSPLVQLEGTWRLLPIEAIIKQIESLRRSAEQAAGGSFVDVTRMVLLSESERQEDISVDVEFAPDVRDVRDLVYTLLQSRKPFVTEVPQLFQGKLRDYQKMGYEWLLHLRKIGCGAVLADDMGLGKTIQVLAYWCYLKEHGLTKGPHLLICPTSLLQNWRAELMRFAPDLSTHLHHGSNRVADAMDFADVAKTYDVVLTTYATAVRDQVVLDAVSWDSVVVDEAQNVKNPDTKQARVVCQLNGHHRIALTGTPIENRLEELWSIFRFSVPGYLGSPAWFRRQFIDPIAGAGRSETSEQLHQLLQPVLLRRSKADPTIQLELPEKWEVLEYAGLTSEQGALYQSVVNRLFLGIDAATTGMSRRGQILTALVRLKQVCNHPCLTVGGSGSIHRSGKLKLLLDLLDDALSGGESAIVFTQFRGMGEILCTAMEQKFGWKPRFLHGGLSPAARGDIVDAFQSGADAAPVLILSLKAGGVGLNLTRANHVFHFDRWWNPAVEDQATDRVFRIGQTKNVQVHKLICTGTLEERIDELIQSKRSLSRAVVGESEGWLADMDDDTLRSLFELDNRFAFEEDES